MITLLFPGQGSQHTGMGKFLYEQFAPARLAFEEASDCLQINFKQLCFNGSDSDLALTENTQPCLVLVSTATQRVLRGLVDFSISAVAGHSVDEYSALVAADVLSFSSALKAVRTRGQAMQSAVPVGKGAMAAVMGLGVQEVEDLCAFVTNKSGALPLSPANFNSPGQIVISGNAKAIEWLRTEFKAEDLWPGTGKKIRIIPLNVSAPFHCALMAPAEKKMREVLTATDFNTARFPVLQNYTAQFHTQASEIRENLIRQVSAPVRWWQSIEALKQRNYKVCIECGSGKVLQGLVKKIDSEFFQVFNTSSLEDIKTIEEFCGRQHK